MELSILTEYFLLLLFFLKQLRPFECYHNSIMCSTEFPQLTAVIYACQLSQFRIDIR